MRIALVGKGGSGKTTLSTLLCRYLASRNLPIVAIDADINQHLGRSLGMTDEEVVAMPPLGIEIYRIKEYLRGSNPLIADADSMIKTTPPGRGSRFLRLQEQNPIYDHFVGEIDGIRLMAVGAFTEEDLGVKCYHSKTGAVELMLNHLIDGEKEYVIVDMTAGADAFASGLFTRFDVTLLVVEPTVKSITVYEQYRKYARDYDVNLKVIGNKVESQEDIDFLKEKIGGDILATLGQSRFVKESDRGRKLAFAGLEAQNKQALETIISYVDRQKKDWKKSYRQAVEFHIKNAESWANSAAGKDLRTQVDSEFVFEETLNKT